MWHELRKTERESVVHVQLWLRTLFNFSSFLPFHAPPPRPPPMPSTPPSHHRKLVERLEGMRRHRSGGGEADCILCGEVFRFYHRSQKRCLDCGKMTCGKCGVEAPAHAGGAGAGGAGAHGQWHSVRSNGTAPVGGWVVLFFFQDGRAAAIVHTQPTTHSLIKLPTELRCRKFLLPSFPLYMPPVGGWEGARSYLYIQQT